MPENSNNYIISFNKANTALLRRHTQAFKDMVGLDNNNTLVSKTDTTKVNNNLTKICRMFQFKNHKCLEIHTVEFIMVTLYLIRLELDQSL